MIQCLIKVMCIFLLDYNNSLKFIDGNILCEVCGDAIDECPDDDRPIQCTKCHMWAHEGCFLLGETCKNISKFKCHICSSGLRKIPKCCVCPINTLHAMVPNKNKTIVYIHYVYIIYLVESYYLCSMGRWFII